MSNYSPLHSWALALSTGLTWGVCIFIVCLAGWLGTGQSEFTSAISSVYLSEIDTFFECAAAGFLGFLDAAFCSLIVAYFYNLFLKRFTA